VKSIVLSTRRDEGGPESCMLLKYSPLSPLRREPPSPVERHREGTGERGRIPSAISHPRAYRTFVPSPTFSRIP